MDQDRLEKEFRKIRNLHQYRYYTDIQVRKLALKNVIKQSADIESLFIDNKDKKLARELLDKYLQDYIPETTSDIQILRSIIYIEISNLKFQNELNHLETLDSKQATEISETIRRNLKELLGLKKSIGMIKDKDNEGENSFVNKFEALKRQFQAWAKNNLGSLTRVCPHCGKMILYKRRMDEYDDGQPHPFYKDRYLYNKKLLELYNQKVLTKEQVAEILEVSTDYIDYIILRFNQNKDEILETRKKKKEDEK